MVNTDSLRGTALLMGQHEGQCGSCKHRAFIYGSGYWCGHPGAEMVIVVLREARAGRGRRIQLYDSCEKYEKGEPPSFNTVDPG